MKYWFFTTLILLGTYLLNAQATAGCFELIESGVGQIDVVFNVTSTTTSSNVDANNRISRGEITLSWTGAGTVSSFTNEAFNWFNDGTTENEVQYRFGPVAQVTNFTQGETILLLSINFNGPAGTINVNSTELINVLNQDLANDNSCMTSYEFAALPVELSSFTAEAIKAKQAQLKWATASETANDYFAVEHSADGGTFTEIGRLAGSGTGTDRLHYAFIHDFPNAGENFYRLRQVDFDGSTAYSEVRSVWINADEAQVRVFPNPTSEQLNLQFTDNSDGAIVRLIDQSGRQIMAQTLPVNTLRTTFRVGHFPRGVYWLQLRKRGKVSGHKIVLH